ncbi:MAG: HAD hydrolase family protein [Lachnospiraceae bacterium]|nr:HAD hydrolase family protein [Lachnospiraceae bacterium]
MKQPKRLSLPGQRIIRSAVAVAVCIVFYLLRPWEGIPFYSATAAMQCIQPYTKDMKKVARKRILGTIVGASCGLLLLLLESWLIDDVASHTTLHYLMVPLFLILTLYLTVVFGIQELAYFSGAVFLALTINHFTDENAFLFALNRLLDTVIGILVGSVVNRLHFPRRRNTDTLYVSALGHSLLDSESRLSDFSKVELNRLIDDGMKFSLSTIQTQATVRELLPGVKLRCPIITMDGAALYDMGKLSYLRTTPMSGEKAARIMSWCHEEGLPFFSNSIEQNLLVIRFRELENEAMKQLFEKKRNSPYRNFIRSEADSYGGVVYLLILEKDETIEKAYGKLMGEPWIGEYRVAKHQSEYKGFSTLKIYDAACSRDAMLRELESIMGTKETVTFGADAQRYDVAIPNSDRNLLVKELKRRFEPIDIRSWKNIFRW